MSSKAPDLPDSEPRVASVLRSPTIRSAIAEAAAEGTISPRRGLGFSTGLVAEHLSKKRSADEDAAFFESRGLTEAIVLLTGRPVLFVKDGLFEKAKIAAVEKSLAPVRKAFAAHIPSVGRVELDLHDTYEWCGTAWRIEDDLLVTNRHVARIFAGENGTGFKVIKNQAGLAVVPRVDFREEWNGTAKAEFPIGDILWIAPDTADAPDMAILRLKKAAKGLKLPPPLRLSNKAPSAQQQIAVVGYPAHDSRNGADAMSSIFQDVYDVKRFAPGEVVRPGNGGQWYLTHDASTLGGNSGSAVFDVNSQEVVGLHFGGSFRKTNYAVKASVIQSLLKRKNWVVVPGPKAKPEAFKEKQRTKKSMEGRKGYQTGFLGTEVPQPKASSYHSVLKVPFSGNALPYTHFSIVMSKTRRLTIFTAENVDGALKVSLKRKDTWGFDPRIPASQQIGHAAFYGPQPFDKGHMVRRENPGWGAPAEAQQGEDDSFIYTNAAPQMPGLNQKTWLSLEDYVLQNAKVEGFKVCVFTGPVLRDDDPTHGKVQVPLDFWKVVVAIDADDGSLLSSAYLLTQEGMMPTEAFRYGPFRTYQVPLRRVEKLANIAFSDAVRKADVFSGVETEAVGLLGIEILGPDDLVLSKK